MGSASHLPFILGAYGATTLIVAALVLRALVDHRVQRQALRRLEARQPAALPDEPA